MVFDPNSASTGTDEAKKGSQSHRVTDKQRKTVGVSPSKNARNSMQ